MMTGGLAKPVARPWPQCDGAILIAAALAFEYGMHYNGLLHGNEQILNHFGPLMLFASESMSASRHGIICHFQTHGHSFFHLPLFVHRPVWAILQMLAMI